MSTIIGLSYCSHDTAVAAIRDGKIIAVYEEEKMTGVKSCYNSYAKPEKGLQALEKDHGITLENADEIAIAQFYVRDFVKGNSLIYDKVTQVSHHDAHTLGAYFTSGMDGKVLSVSHDGKGNRSRGKIYLCEDGTYELVHSQHIPTTASIAGLWASATGYLGWKMLKDEGKVVGLAAHGKFNQRIYDAMKNCIYYDGNMSFKPSNFEALFHYTFDSNLRKEGIFEDKELRADFAYNLQILTEELMKEFLIDLKSRYPEYTKLCLSGGLFANVKLNMFINDLGLFEEIYIHPAMGDSGLALGAALIAANAKGEWNQPQRLDNAFLGQQHGTQDWLDAIEPYKDQIEIESMTYDRVGELIDQGEVVGVFIGRTEYGPRALGNRSIVVKPTDPETHRKLNEKLRRTEIMPFAPSVLAEHAKDIFEIKQSEYTAEFMTICYNTKDEWMDKIPAVVHRVDKTARPQLVRKEYNANFHNVISSYMKISGIPVVLNTSLNAHGEPINNYPSQVIKHLLDNSIDRIVTEDFILKRKG
jgi:carbamoyltransferase